MDIRRKEMAEVKSVTIRIDEQLIQKLDALAIKEHRTRNNMVAHILSIWAEKNKVERSQKNGD